LEMLSAVRVAAFRRICLFEWDANTRKWLSWFFLGLWVLGWEAAPHRHTHARWWFVSFLSFSTVMYNEITHEINTYENIFIVIKLQRGT
jgi:hypothetical protein